MAASRRFLVLALAMAFALVPMFAAGAVTSGELATAQKQLADARSAAGAAAADFAAAESKLAETANRIGELQGTIDAGKAKVASLQDVARARAVFAYTHASNNLDLFIGATGPEEAVRRTQLLDHANQSDNASVKKLATLNADLREQENRLKQEQSQQQQVTSQLDAKRRTLAAALDNAATVTANLQKAYDTEIAAAADQAARDRLATQQAALRNSQPTGNGGGAGQIIVNPGGGSFMCPVAGAVYTDDFGGARAHPGIDMFVPTGTRAVAVKAGTISYVPNAGAGGNEAYLNANDGNTYYYAHFSSFVGGARSVAQGEVIGLTGMTGNATAPHLHFEIRIGGPNGGRINPYPTLKSSGC